MAFFFGCKKEEAPPQPNTETGHLLITVNAPFGQPLPETKIQLTQEKLTKEGITDEDGRFLFQDIPVGDWMLTASHDHYLTHSQKVTIIKDQQIRLDLILQPGDTFLKLSRNSLHLDYKSGEDTLTVQTNNAWRIEGESPWINVAPRQGEGTMQLSVSYTNNTEIDLRETTFNLISGETSYPITIFQEPQLKLISKNDGTRLHSDSVYMIFNRKINVQELKSLYSLCVTGPLNYDYIENGYGIRFKYGCARLGMEYPFELEVVYGNGNGWKEVINIPFYSGRLTFGDLHAHKFVLTDDNQTVWMTVVGNEGLNKLYSVAIPSLTINKVIDLPSTITDMSINPHNGLLYLSAYDDQTILVYNPENGQLVKTIMLQVLPGDPPVYPNIHPGSLLFTHHGFGVLNVGNAGSSWKIIESNKQDTIYYLPDHEAYQRQSLANMQWIAGKKQILGFLTSDNQLAIIDGEQKKLVKTLNVPLPFTSYPAIHANKKNNAVYLRGYWEELVLDIRTGTPINRSYAALNFWGFSYRPQEDYFVFGVSEDHLLLLDYATAETVFSIRTGVNGSAETTTDGKYLILVSVEGLTLFDMKMFPSRKQNNTSPSGFFMRSGK